MTFTYNRTIRFKDTDAAGVVYFANVLAICHEAYEESLALAEINIKDFFTNPAVAFPVIHANVDFIKPMFCGDKLHISLIPHKQGLDKFEIAYEIVVDSFIVAKASTRHVCIDANTRTKRELPEQMIQWLSAVGEGGRERWERERGGVA